MKRCPHCRQVLKTERLGVVLSPLKAGIVDVIKRAGDIGISSIEILGGELYRDRRRGAQSTIKAHVWQINEALAQTPFIIVSDRRRWFLQRRHVRRAA
jgi:hypothetical protein